MWMVMRSLSCAAILAACASTVSAQPPAGDPLARLAEEVTAVTGAGRQARITLAETRFGVAAQRTIGVGDEYLDGWRVTQIVSGAVTLAKGTATRTVPLTGSKAAPAAATPMADLPGEVAATNAVEGAKGSPADIRAAVAAGDIRKAFELGGSALDIGNAFAARNTELRAFLDAGAEARFIHVDGRIGVNMSQAPQAGSEMRRTASIYPAELNGMAPPPDASRVYLAGPWISIDAEGNTVMDVERMPNMPGGVRPTQQPPRSGGVNFGFSTPGRNPANPPPR